MYDRHSEKIEDRVKRGFGGLQDVSLHPSWPPPHSFSWDQIMPVLPLLYSAR